MGYMFLLALMLLSVFVVGIISIYKAVDSKLATRERTAGNIDRNHTDSMLSMLERIGFFDEGTYIETEEYAAVMARYLKSVSNRDLLRKMGVRFCKAENGEQWISYGNNIVYYD